MKRNKFIVPVVKWVGGKRQIISSIIPLLPKEVEDYNYIEPFIGGGALFFYLQPKKAIINDLNIELINVYKVIKTDLEILFIDLKKHKNESDYFYSIREWDRMDYFKKLTKVERASRMIYLNKTCFNGLYRVNNAGEFNVPFGFYKSPNILNEDVLRAVSKYLNQNEIEIRNEDYMSVLNKLNDNCFVYLDPPYHPISQTSSFTGYIEGGWKEEEQVRLKKACDVLNDKGIKFLLSNSASFFIKDLYKDYEVHIVKANRSINSDAAKRGQIDEILIRNYG